jgi:hypothetical protein
MATLLNTDGTEEPVNPTGAYLDLAAIRGYFPSGVMDSARVGPDTWLLVDDLGYQMGLPINSRATALYQGAPPRTKHVIVGPAFLCTGREVGAPR